MNELIYTELVIAERIASGLRTANVHCRIEERTNWEGKYWVVITGELQKPSHKPAYPKGRW